ncbi:MAG: tRNA (adenine-N1)-methyltransferase [Chloroflexi bacterium]|nr:tRNA (adenine-N1)-methyltransferase [Chloroflexota bacterium]
MTQTSSGLKEGDLVLLIDRKERRYMVRLKAGGSFHSHLGHLPHDALIGREEGIRVTTSLGNRMLALRPTLADFILEMPRKTQVLYPKDLGTILMAADIYPGARVLEAGIGSAALTLTLLRAVGTEGQVISYEIRPDLAQLAVKNIEAYMGDLPPNFCLRSGDVCESIAEQDLDRIILDIPDPWRALPTAAIALRMGGILLVFVPTVLQVHQAVGAMRQSGLFQRVETVEVLVRPWHIAKTSARPAHRMVSHTGFLTTAMRCAQLEVAQPEPNEGEPSEEEP